MSSPPESLGFKCALVTGGAGGIGKAIAESFIAKGKKVIIAGRTESKLAETSKEIKATAHYVLDVSDISSIAGFVAKITKEHPDLDCVVNNAGVQRPFQIMGPDYDFDLKKADQEIDTNIRGPLHLCVELIDHFKTKEHPVIMNVSSILGFVPMSVINPVYNGSKAWVHFFTLNLRTQLSQAEGGKHIKVIEIAPPSVETDLHRERKDPDDNKKKNGNKVALSLEEFMEEIEQGWKSGDDLITAGPGKKMVSKWNESMGQLYTEMIK